MTARILNVDDDEAGRYIVGRLLRHAGFEVLEAARGLDALEMAHANHPDLILLDVNLPDISGHEVCARLRADPEFANVPVLMLSASFISGPDRVRGLTGGADAYLAEPVDASELVAVIQSLLRMRSAERDVVALNRALELKVHELETTIETLPIGLAIANDPQCSDIRVNAAMAAMTGLAEGRNFTRGEDGAGPYRVKASGEDLDPSDLPLQRAARGELVRDQETEIVRADGSSVFVYGHASPLFDVDGKVRGSVGAFMDVTERKAAEAKERLLADMTGLLAEALDIEKTLTGTAQVAVRHIADWCVIDAIQPDGEFKRVAAVHRDPAKQPFADEIREHHGPEKGRSAAVYQAFDGGRAVLVNEITAEAREVYRRNPELNALLKELGIQSYISAPLVARGRSLGVMTLVRSSKPPYSIGDVSVAQDLATRAALALDNAMLFQSAEDANRAKDAFFAVVSHELRTPLTSILGWATMLTKVDLDENTKTMGLEEIRRSAKSQARIIDDLLDTARIAAGKIHLEMRPVTLDSVVDDSVMLVQQQLADKHIEVTRTNEPQAIVSGDRQRLVQIASNLLTNASKFTADGGKIGITVSIDRPSNTAAIAVRDNGRGIAVDFLPHVFDRFTQQEVSAARIGLGLGLSIVKSFVELHGGVVTVTSDGEGTGSEFTVRLPLVGANGSGPSASLSLRGNGLDVE
jgi:PAS domain S-box-containing protein